MRNSFVIQLIREMEKNDKIILLTGDLGYNALESIREKFPNRFINAGIAEANMIGVAAGFALSGYTALAYSIAPFVTMRCYEQIRLDVCYHNLNVKLIGVGGGFNYGSQGVTHHTIEDMAIMRVLPEMKVICPASAWEAERATEAIINTMGPAYLRLGIKIPEEIHSEKDEFLLSKGFLIRSGNDLTIINTGNTLTVAQEVVNELKKNNLNTELLHLPCIKPLDEQLIISSATKTKNVFTIEESSVIGGLGSAVAELLLEKRVPIASFKRFGMPDRFIKDVGSPSYLRSVCGLDGKTIAQKILSCL